MNKIVFPTRIIYGIVDVMENKEIETKPQKSTLLLVLFIIVLFNAVQLFRTSINNMYFTEDISGDYAVIKATVLEFKPVVADNTEDKPQNVPVFSFLYKEGEVILEAPDFIFDQEDLKSQPYQRGEEYTLWVHKRWGQLMVPPIMGPVELGKSQLRISLVFMLLTVAIWFLRNKLAKKQ